MDQLSKLVRDLFPGEEVVFANRDGAVSVTVSAKGKGSMRYSYREVMSRECIAEANFDVATFVLGRQLLKIRGME
jgi:hypothetical protein